MAHIVLAEQDPDPEESGEIVVRPGRGGVVVLVPQGVFDREHAARLDQLLSAEIGQPVVIDLTDCVLGDPEVLQGLDPDRWSRTSDQVCLSCARLSARRLLAHSGASRRLAVFRSAEDAMRVRLSADADQGHGWNL